MAANNHERSGAGFERSDVDTSGVVKFAIALCLVCAVAFVLLVGLFKYFLSETGGPRPAYQLNVDARSLPPEPRLEETPVLDLKAMRGAEQQVLNGYGWVDQKQGVVRIPIDRAMDLLAQRGLPSRPQNQAPAPSSATVPTAANLGQKMQPPGGPLSGELK
jgi:hypothetical protein